MMADARAARVLVVGSGAREHALVWKLATCASAPQVWAAPGNAGTAAHATNLGQLAATDVAGICDAVDRHGIQTVIIGPEDALAAGLADRLRARGAAVIGPSRAAAQLESSKVFGKQFLQRHGIPYAHAQSFTDIDALATEVRSQHGTSVVKQDGLAQGKGVLVSADQRALLAFGEEALGAGPVLIEQYLEGFELSLFLLLDGTCSDDGAEPNQAHARAALLPLCTDYKRAFDGDQGPNTGGMGAVCPAPLADERLLGRLQREVIAPTLAGLAADGLAFPGVLFVGLMVTADGPRVLEFNVRFGDPETQAFLPLLAGDFLQQMQQAATGRLDPAAIATTGECAITVVVAADGYPAGYESGLRVDGLPAQDSDRLLAFHAGTAAGGDGLVTGGGRCFAVTGVGVDVASARLRAYEGAAQVRFPGAWYRHDIAGGD